MQVFISGGCGFIGSALVRMLSDRRDVHIINYDALTYAANPEAVGPAAHSGRYTFIHGDIGDASSVAAALDRYRPDAVVHLAAESHVDRSVDGPAAFVDTNICGTLTLLEETLKYWQSLSGDRSSHFRFLHVSTDEVFGSLDPEAAAATEGAPYQPNSPYAASKAASDHLVRAWHRTYGLPTIITNGGNTYGPWQFPEKLIPLMILNGLLGQPLPVYGDGRNIRDWLHVDDHASALVSVLEHGRTGETYNIAANAERTNLTVVQALCNLLDAREPLAGYPDRRALIQFVSDRPGHDLRYAINATKIQGELGWMPSVAFEEGLADTVAWYLANRDWLLRMREERSAGRRLGTGR